MKSSLVVLALILAVSGRPMKPRASFTKQNGLDAIALNKKFTGLTATTTCKDGEDACVNNQLAQCVGTSFVLEKCGSKEICAALPLTNKAGTEVRCTTQSELDARIKETGALSNNSSMSDINNAAKGGKGGKGNGGDDAQTSLTLDPSVIAKGFAQNGQETEEPGQVASLTSSNNFINFCKGKKITNGQQLAGGSCNPAPMGEIPSSDNMPSCKFKNPKNLDTIKANTAFTIQMAIKGMQTGFFVNAQQNYFSAPQQLNGQGQIQGHSHVVIEEVKALDSTTPLNPLKFAFFKGLNDAASGGVLSADVTAGLPAGVYKMSSINSAANHQPVLVPIAQHGSLDDVVYFTVTNDGKAAGGAADNNGGDTAANGNGGKNANGKNGGGKKNGGGNKN